MALGPGGEWRRHDDREAAALGIPVYSIFRGKVGAVDRQLAKDGRLVLSENLRDVHDKIKFQRRAKQEARQPVKRSALDEILQHLQEILKTEGRKGIQLPANGKLRGVVLAND